MARRSNIPVQSCRWRRGISSLIAMLFLILFSILALGFYSSVNLNVRVSGNEKKMGDALDAAESGMEIIRYQLRNVTLPAGTAPSSILSTVATQLQTGLNGSGTMGTKTVGYVAGASSIGIPSLSSQYVTLLTTVASFRADISLFGSKLLVTVVGRDNTASVSRTIQMQFQCVETVSSVFNYGMATNGALTLSGGILKGVPDATRGSFLSTTLGTSTPLTMSGSAVVSGQVYFTNPTGNVSGSGSISGTTNTSQWPQYIHANTTAPEFPAVDTTPYLNYLSTITPTIIAGSTSATPLSNIRIKAGTNPTFSGGPTINGLIYIEAPNKVTFSGGAHITGVIVVDNANDTTSTNAITFSGASSIQGPENLPASYGTLKTMTGASILAPNFGVTLSGGSSTFGGSVLIKSISMSGGSGGSVNGSVIAYGTASTTFSGGSGFTFTNTGAATPPTAGVHFSGHYYAVASSWNELTP